MYPVFMYHKIGASVSERADTFLNVSAHDFRRQMRVLAKLGYSVRPFAEIAEAILRQQSLPARTCAVTFDDGYTCVGQYAAPILAEYSFPGTVFVVSQAIGKSNEWDAATGRPVLSLMDENALRRLHSAGWEIAGHTRTHPHLDRLSDKDAWDEISGGREELATRFGIPIQTFCYPFGDYNERTPQIAAEAGFQGACTTQSGMARHDCDSLLLPRVKIPSRGGLTSFLYRLLVYGRLARPETPPLKRTLPQSYSPTTAPLE